MGPLFESPPGPLLTSDMLPLDRYGTHQKTIGDLNRCILHLTQGWEWLGEGGHYSRRSRINAGGPTATTIQIISWAIIEIRHGARGQI